MNEKQCIKHPKVFISYSWTPESTKQKVQNIATRLSNDGVHVVIDDWDLKEGQDKYVFMEQMVNDSSVEKVLLLCNKQYAEKADQRNGGVGVEGTIISAQVYKNAKQTKFIPIILEYAPNGDPCLPTFVESAIYIDLSNDATFEENYDKLLRNLYDKPKSKRPPIGIMPEYLNDEEPQLLLTTNRVRTIKNALQNNNSNIKYLIENYISAFLSDLVGFRLDYGALNRQNFIYEIDKSINSMLPLKEDFLSFIQTIINTPYCTGELLIAFLERMLQTYEDNNIELFTGNSIQALANDNFRYFNQDLFLSLSATLLNNERYDLLAEIVKANFIVIRARNEGEAEVQKYTRFREYNYTLNEHKNKRDNLNRVSVIADMIKNNANSAIFKDIVATDILLYYLSLFYPSHDKWKSYWYPEISCYNRQFEVLPKLISKRYFDKIKIMFDVNTADEFKQKIAEIEEPNIRNSYGYQHIPNIKTGLCAEKVCTVD